MYGTRNLRAPDRCDMRPEPGQLHDGITSKPPAPIVGQDKTLGKLPGACLAAMESFTLPRQAFTYCTPFCGATARAGACITS